MKVKSTIFRRKGGTKWTLQITYPDPETGRKRTREKQFDRRIDAIDRRNEMVAEIEKTQGRISTGGRMTFRDLVEFSKRSFYRPAVLAEGRKIDGVRSYKTVWGFLETLSAYFGNRKIGQIEGSDLRAYKIWRLKRPSNRSRSPVPISLTTINRELSTMRRMMKHAFLSGWVTRDIFAGAKVIDIDAEKARTRILTEGEEQLLLAACEGSPQEHLKAIVLFALDSAMRRGEILKLRWQDLDIENNTIRIVGTHTKSERQRVAPLTNRTIAELRKLPAFGSTGEIFPFSEFKRSWSTAKRIAGIEDLRFHDLRRTAITKFNLRGISLATAGKIAGHARLETTVKHYIANDEAIVRDVARILNDNGPVISDGDSDFIN